MKYKFSRKIVAGLAGAALAVAIPAQADLTLTLDDGAGHTATLSDGGSGFVLFNGSLGGSIWNLNIDVALSKPVLGSQFDPRLDVSIQSANSTAAGTLTITATSDGFGPLAANVGIATLAAGGAGANGSIATYGLVNGVQVASLGPLTANPWSGTTSGNVSGLASTFSIGEKIVITHNTAGDGHKGDIDFSVAAVPEPTTVIAGALLLLPFSASAIRVIRRNRKA